MQQAFSGESGNRSEERRIVQETSPRSAAVWPAYRGEGHSNPRRELVD